MRALGRSNAVTDAVGRLAPLAAVAPRFDAKWLVIGVAVALVVWLALVPLVFLLWQSFLTPQTAAEPAQYTLENFRTAYLSSDNARLVVNSLQFAVGAALERAQGSDRLLLEQYRRKGRDAAAIEHDEQLRGRYTSPVESDSRLLRDPTTLSRSGNRQPIPAKGSSDDNPFVGDQRGATERQKHEVDVGVLWFFKVERKTLLVH